MFRHSQEDGPSLFCSFELYQQGGIEDRSRSLPSSLSFLRKLTCDEGSCAREPGEEFTLLGLSQKNPRKRMLFLVGLQVVGFPSTVKNPGDWQNTYGAEGMPPPWMKGFCAGFSSQTRVLRFKFISFCDRFSHHQ